MTLTLIVPWNKTLDTILMSIFPIMILPCDCISWTKFQHLRWLKRVQLKIYCIFTINLQIPKYVHFSVYVLITKSLNVKFKLFSFTWNRHSTACLGYTRRKFRSMHTTGLQHDYTNLRIAFTLNVFSTEFGIYGKITIHLRVERRAYTYHECQYSMITSTCTLRLRWLNKDSEFKRWLILT